MEATLSPTGPPTEKPDIPGGLYIALGLSVCAFFFTGLVMVLRLHKEQPVVILQRTVVDWDALLSHSHGLDFSFPRIALPFHDRGTCPTTSRS